MLRARPGALGGNGTCSIFDLFCVLNCFSGDCGCENDACSCEGSDITGSGNEPEDCGPDGVCNIFDLFAVLGCFGGDDPCCGGLP